MSSRCQVFFIGLLVCIGLSAGTALEAGEISLIGTSNTGDYGTGVDSDNQNFTLRYVTGNTFQIRVEVPLLRVHSSYGVLQTGFGSTPLDEAHHGGPMGSSGHGSGADAGGGKLTEEIILADSWSTGVGDVRVSAFKRLMGGGIRLFRLDAGVEIKLPTADETQQLGTGEMDARLALSGAYRFWSATGFGGVGYNILGDPDWVELDDVFDIYVGLESDPLAAGRFTLSGWLEGRDEVVSGAGSYAAAGFGFETTGRLRWRGALMMGLTDAAQDMSVIFGLSYGLNPESWNKGLYR